MLKRFIGFYRPYWKLFCLDMLCVVAAGAVALTFPQLLKILMEDIFQRSPQEILRLLGWIIPGLIAMYMVHYACNYITLSLGHIMGARMEADMRKQLFQQYQKLSFSYYDTHNTGEMLSRLVNDLFDITEFAHHGPETLLMSGVKIIGAFILLLSIDIRLTLMLFSVTLVMAVFTFIAGTVYLASRNKPSMVTALPGMFITFVVTSYILWISPEHGGPVGVGLELPYAYLAAGFTAIAVFVWAIMHGKENSGKFEQ